MVFPPNRTRSWRMSCSTPTVSNSLKCNHSLPRWLYSSNNYYLKYTISLWKTPEGKRHFIVSSLPSFCPQTLPALTLNKAKQGPTATYMSSFFQHSVHWRRAVRSVHNETTTKAKRQAKDFSFVITKGRVVSPLVMHRTIAEADSQLSSARQRQLGECSLVLLRLTSVGPNNFRFLIWCLHETLSMENEGPLDSLGFNLQYLRSCILLRPVVALVSCVIRKKSPHPHTIFLMSWMTAQCPGKSATWNADRKYSSIFVSFICNQTLQYIPRSQWESCMFFIPISRMYCGFGLTQWF